MTLPQSKTKIKAKTKAIAVRERAELTAERVASLARFDQANPDVLEQVRAKYSSAGDKYRLTLVNISSVEGWLNPEGGVVGASLFPAVVDFDA